MMRQIGRIFLLVTMLFTISLNTYSSKVRTKEIQTTKVEKHESGPTKWVKIMDAIIQVESGGDPKAKHGSSLGILQITPILVQECNEILKRQGSKKRYTLGDRLNVTKSKEMFILIMNQYNKTGNAVNACKIWNGGPYSKKVKQEYWKQFLKFYKM